MADFYNAVITIYVPFDTKEEAAKFSYEKAELFADTEGFENWTIVGSVEEGPIDD